MIKDRKRFFVGFGMFIGFIILIIIIFLPVFKGQNGLEYMDALYNSISKGSANYIPHLRKKAADFREDPITVTLKMDTEDRAQKTGPLFEKGGATVRVSGKDLTVEGDLGLILENCINDSELMYNNAGQDMMAKYGLEGRQVLYNWYRALKGMNKVLKDQGKFREADIAVLVLEKGVECSYNYYNIEPRKISDSPGIMIFSLLFYVIYTVWYGFAFMFMFEGWGMNLEH